MSLVSLPIYLYAFIALKNRNALYILLFAYLYLIDTGIDIGFTIVFCIKWFAEARHASKDAIDSVVSAVGAAANEASASSSNSSSIPTQIASLTEAAATTATTTIAQNAGFSIATAPPQPPPLFKRMTEALAEAAALAEPAVAASASSTDNTANQSTSVARESVVTIILTVVILLMRIYATFIIIAYARKLVRQENLRKYNGTPKKSARARLQCILLTPFESFWTGFSSRSSTYSPLNGDGSALALAKTSSGSRRHNAGSSSIASDAGLLASPYQISDDEDEDDSDNAADNHDFVIKSSLNLDHPDEPALNTSAAGSSSPNTDIDLERLGADDPFSPKTPRS